MIFRLLTESDVRSVLSMDDLIEVMTSALGRFSAGEVVQPVRTVIPVGDDKGVFAVMPTYAHNPAALGAKLVTVFAGNAGRGLPTHLAIIALLDPETGAMRALLDGRYITEARTAAVSAVSSRLLARKEASSLAIIGSGVQARSHLEALARVHRLRQAAVWSPNRERRERFATAAFSLVCPVKAVDHAGEAVVGADLIVLATSSTTPVIESGWVKPGAHIMSVGACRPTDREIDPVLIARARLFVDSRASALVESGDIVIGISEGRFGPDHVAAEVGEVVNGAAGRRTEGEITLFKSLGLAIEDGTAADLAVRRAEERGIGTDLNLASRA